MGTRKLYRVTCDFCAASGPIRRTEVEAVKAAGKCKRSIQLIYTSFYGNELWSCKECVTNNAEAREFVILSKE